MKAFSKTTGHEIRGCSEMIPGTALIQADSWEQLPSGAFDFEWDGETEVCWDGQTTVERKGQRVFIDTAGNEVLESDIELRP